MADRDDERDDLIDMFARLHVGNPWTWNEYLRWCAEVCGLWPERGPVPVAIRTIHGRTL